MDLSFLEPENFHDVKKFLLNLGLSDNQESTRAKILNYWRSIDVPSCPGSGKTTLVVAKLAWAIERWQFPGVGICVLSHTNVAKNEINNRLSSSEVSKLSSYPHFVGTIHEFIYKYLSLPYLKSEDKLIRLIDDDFHDLRAKRILSYGNSRERYAARSWQTRHPNRNLIQNLRIIDSKLVFRENGKYQELPIAPNCNAFTGFENIAQQLNTEGFYCFDELLSLAQSFIEKNVGVVKNIRLRFPLVIVDEAQDTHEIQAKLLNTIFPPEDHIVQRFGDNDQQIFDIGEDQTIDPFPNIARSIQGLSLSESQRCRNLFICKVANTLSVSKSTMKPFANNGENYYKPHIILFNQETVRLVIPNFINLVKGY